MKLEFLVVAVAVIMLANFGTVNRNVILPIIARKSPTGSIKGITTLPLMGC